MVRKALPAMTRLVLATVVALTSVAFVVPVGAATADYGSAGSWPAVTWHLKAPRGVASDASGNVYVADTGNNRIVKFDVAGRFVTSWGAAGGENGNFKEPWDVECDPSGKNVYVADTMNHRVQQFTVDGSKVTFVRKWGKAGGPDYTGSNPGEFNEPHGIALDASGNVYVVDTKNYRVQKFSPVGQFERQWGTAGSDQDKFLEPWAIDVAPNGWVYVLDADLTNCYIRVFDGTGTPVEFSTGGNGWGGYRSYSDPPEGRFKRPLGIAVDDDGNVYVSDSTTTTSWIQKFSPEGLFMTAWGVHQEGDGTMEVPHFLRPSGLDASGSGMDVRVLVADGDTRSSTSSGGDRIREFDGEGLPLMNRDPLGILGSHGDAWGRHDEPWDVGIGEGGSVYVADRMNHRVQRFSSTGQCDIASPGDIPVTARDANGYFDQPSAVAYDPVSQFVFVAEVGNDRVQRMTADLQYEGRKWGAIGTADGAFTNPQGIAVGPAPSSEVHDVKRWVFVSDTGNNRIQMFDIDGNHRATVTGISQPGGLVVDTDGSVYVADSGNRRIVKLVPNNAAWTSWSIAASFGNSGYGDPRLSRPWGIALDDAGFLYVSDVDAHKIKKYSKSGAFVTAWSSKGSAKGMLDSPRGLDVSADGIVYVADSVNDRFQAFVKPIDIIINSPTDGGAYNAPVTPNVTFGLGAVSTGITLDGAPWVDGAVTGEGVHVLRGWAEDVHGLIHENVVQFTIDYTVPNTSANALMTYPNYAVINLSATDGLSGVKTTYWSLNDGPPQQGTSVSVTKAGTYNLHYWSEDKAGNQESPNLATFTVTDTWAPVTTCNVQSSYVNTAYITLKPSDSGSAIKATYYQLDGKAPVKANSLTVASLGNHTLQYWSEDMAGNVETKRSASFNVKQATAVVAGRTDGKVPYKGTSTVTATLKTTSGSVIKGKSLKLYKSYDGKTWYQVTTIWSASGNYWYDVVLTKKTYFRWKYEGNDSYGASIGNTSVNAKAYLTKPAAPTTAYRKKATYMSGYLKTRHSAGSRVVTLRAYRYENGRWVRRATGYATAKNYSSYSRYTGKVVFPYKGKWRVRAYHNDGDHLATKSKYDYVTVK